MDQHLVSVVIPAHRAFRTLPQTLSSVRSSSLVPSVILVEDGIVDRTAELLDNDPNIFHIANLSPRGAASARNQGLERVVTPYVIFLDSDDLISADLLCSATQVLDQSGADVCLTPWSFHDQDRPIGTVKIPQNAGNRKRVLDWLLNVCQPPCSVVWRASSLRKLGGWMDSFGYNDDAELMLRSFMAGVVVSVSSQGCGFYVQHHSSDRLSRSSADKVHGSNDYLYQRVCDFLSAVEESDAQHVLGLFCYEQARRQYREGNLHLGQTWLARSRQHGYAGHRGTLSHRCLVRLLGLPLKERLAGLRDSHPLLRHRFG